MRLQREACLFHVGCIVLCVLVHTRVLRCEANVALVDSHVGTDAFVGVTVVRVQRCTTTHTAVVVDAGTRRYSSRRLER